MEGRRFRDNDEDEKRKKRRNRIIRQDSAPSGRSPRLTLSSIRTVMAAGDGWNGERSPARAAADCRRE
ncbi:hypothetical protein MTO96_049201 [Rhipicephalus appendiculatus]